MRLQAPTARSSSLPGPCFFSAKVITARFYADALLPQAAALAQSIRQSGASTNRMPVDLF